MERLNQVASYPTVRLTHYGRKSGKAYEVTIWFVVEGERVYVGTANVDRQWVHNVQKTPKVGLLIAEQKFEGEARFLTDKAQHKHVQDLMFKKYWKFRPILAMGRMLMVVGLLKDRSGSFEVTLRN